MTSLSLSDLTFGMQDMDLPSSEESEEEVENKHRGAEGDEVPLEQRLKVWLLSCLRPDG